jgi:acyl-CoA thioester hydrolase
VDIDVRVRYAETDRMGVVYYANYFVWFEMGRSEYCRQRSFNYHALEELGYRMVVSEAYCKYRQSARYDDMVTVRTFLRTLTRRSIIFSYLVMRKVAEEILVEGETKHLCVDDEGKSRIIPDPYLSHLSQCLPPQDHNV